MAISLADDWIKAGRCNRVIVISADNITTENSMDWFGAGFLASGVAATDENVEDAAIPFDRRRHGMIVGMGAAALVVESREAARQRGIQPICDVLSVQVANSAFHATRLHIGHICDVMEKLISEAEASWGIDRYKIAPHTVFVSHETYTPARGGSASAEINALRKVFGRAADQVVIANTKGYTGHAMATGIEEVVAVKALETGIVPPVANFKEVDPELGRLNLSSGGSYPVQFALRLGAGFGSQISMSLLRWVPTRDGRHRAPVELGYAYRISEQNVWQNWLRTISGPGIGRSPGQRPDSRLADGCTCRLAATRRGAGTTKCTGQRGCCSHTGRCRERKCRGRPSGCGTGSTDHLRKNRLSAGYARPGTRLGGGSGHRYGETGRDVRRNSGSL
jgi:hypothetical protein